MRLLSLDYDPVYGEDTLRTSFSSDVSAFDYDVVVWDPESSFREYQYYGDTYRGLPSLSDDRSVRIQADAARRRREFIDFLHAGRALIVIVRTPQKCFVDSGRRTYSGTGSRRVTTKVVDEFDLWSALPVSGIQFVPARGSRIELVGDGPLLAVLRKYKDLLTYEAVISGEVGTAIAKVVGTDRVVGAIMKTKGGGHLVLLPAPNLEADDGESDDEQEIEDEGAEATESDGEGWKSEAPQFQRDLLGALAGLSAGGVATRPGWAADYVTDAQRKLRDNIAAQQKRVENARDRLAGLHQQRDEAEARDQLFLGTGRALEVEVAEVMRLLGGKVIDPEPGRDDWRVQFTEQNAVLEVKGVSKSAAERHAAQLEKWVAGAYEETGAMPKGILVANTWKDTPLAERTEADFPDQMLKYSEGRGHCLVTGLQLFVIRSDIEADPSRAQYWRELLLATSGVVTEARDWQMVIQQVGTTDSTDDSVS